MKEQGRKRTDVRKEKLELKGKNFKRGNNKCNKDLEG
jgi:hypothetical protein